VAQFSIEKRGIDEILQTHNDCPKAILIGNGFNTALPIFGKHFRWDRLKENVISELHHFEKTLLEKHEWRFESALNDLNIAIDTMKNMNSNAEHALGKQIDFLATSATALKRHFFTAILRAHPDKHVFKYSNDARRFSSLFMKFNRVYSTNYDLLLYWALEGAGWRNHRDGFGGGKADEIPWIRSNTQQNVFYLHGNLNYREWRSEDYLMKQSYSIYGDIQGIIDANRCLVVSECNAIQKWIHITQSDNTGYLQKTINRLGNQTGILVTHGVS
jgi:hypothetical protein